LLDACKVALLGFGGGFILGYWLGYNSLFETYADIWSASFFLGLVFTCVVVLAWLWGFIRLALVPRFRRAYGITSVVVLIVLGMGVTALGIAIVLGNNILMEAIGMFYAYGAFLLPLIALLFIVLAIIMNRVDTTAVIEENNLNAELYQVRLLSFYGINAAHDIKRRRQLAKRGPVVHIRIREGGLALLSHSILSQVRQFEGLLSLIFCGAALAPSGAVLLFGSLGFIGAMLWIYVMVFMTGRAKKMVGTFYADIDNRMLRSHLPFSTLTLLILDCAPAFILTSLVSLTVLFFVSPLPLFLPLVLFGLCLNFAILLCGGLQVVKVPRMKFRPDFDVALFAFSVVVALLSLSGSIIATLGGAGVVCATYLLVVMKGQEADMA